MSAVVQPISANPRLKIRALVTRLVARQQAQRLAEGIAAEQRHLLDPHDRAFQQMACDHPETCACPPGGTT